MLCSLNIYLYCCVHIVGKLPAWVLNKIAQMMAPKVAQPTFCLALRD